MAGPEGALKRHPYIRSRGRLTAAGWLVKATEARTPGLADLKIGYYEMVVRPVGRWEERCSGLVVGG